jgi:uncharacterized membrane protein YkoI
MSVTASVVLSAQEAVLQALVSNPNTTVHAIELEEEDGMPWWQVELVDASGFKFDAVPIRAN